MSVPVLKPVSETSTVTLSSGSSPSDVENNTQIPLGLYSDSDSGLYSQYFCSGAAEQVSYTYKKLGGDVLDIELTSGSIFAAYEEAVLEYSYILNIHQAKNSLSDLLGASTGTFDHDGQLQSGSSLVGTNVNLKYPRFEFAYSRRVGYAFPPKLASVEKLQYTQRLLVVLKVHRISIYNRLYLLPQLQIHRCLFMERLKIEELTLQGFIIKHPNLCGDSMDIMVASTRSATLQVMANGQTTLLLK